MFNKSIKQQSQKTFFYIFIASCAVYYACSLLRNLWLQKDGALYFLLGSSLAQTNSYNHFYAPPGYPFILSSVIKIFGENILYLRTITIVFAIASLAILVNLLYKTSVTRKNIVLIIFFSAFSPLFIDSANILSSEMPYIFFSWLTIYLLLNDKITLPRICISALLAACAFYIRSAGISLCIALLVFLFLKRKYLYTLTASLILAITTSPWIIAVAHSKATYIYTITRKDYYEPINNNLHLFDIPIRFFTNLAYYSGKVVVDLFVHPLLQNVTFGNILFIPKIIFGIAVSFMLLKGFIESLKKEITFIECYIFIYIVMLLLYSFRTELFLLPLYPFLLVYILTVTQKPRWNFFKAPFFIIITACLVWGNTVQIKNIIYKKDITNQASVSSPELFSWIKVHTPQDSVIMAQDAFGISIYTHRKTMLWNLTPYDASAALQKIKEQKIDYLVIEKNGGVTTYGKKIFDFDKYISPVLEKNPSAFTLAHRTITKPEILIYKVNKEQ